jgi:hypothetical protein
MMLARRRLRRMLRTELAFDVLVFVVIAGALATLILLVLPSW